MRHVKTTILFLSNSDGHTVTWFFTLESAFKNLCFCEQKIKTHQKYIQFHYIVRDVGRALKYIVVMLEEN